MPPQPRSWRLVHKVYEDLRLRYFATDRRCLPAEHLRWVWLPDRSPNLGATYFDEDGDPETVAIHPFHRRSDSVLRITLLHELTHMRLFPRGIRCGVRSKLWRAEQARLAALGAPLL